MARRIDPELRLGNVADVAGLDAAAELVTGAAAPASV
jgi:hypothetical protein